MQHGCILIIHSGYVKTSNDTSIRNQYSVMFVKIKGCGNITALDQNLRFYFCFPQICPISLFPKHWFLSFSCCFGENKCARVLRQSLASNPCSMVEP